MGLRDSRDFFAIHFRQKSGQQVNDYHQELARMGENLRYLRKLRPDRTLKVAAEDIRKHGLKITDIMLSSIERGQYHPVSLKKIIALSNYYNIRWYDLVKNEIIRKHYYEPQDDVQNGFQPTIDFVGKNLRYMRKRIPQRTGAHLTTSMRNKGIMVTHSLISLLEKGRVKTISFERIIDIANFFGVKWVELVSEDISEKYI